MVFFVYRIQRRSAGFRVEAFASAEEFLASGRVVETACLILDLRMPGMNGLQLQRRLAEGSKPVPIIFLSAYSLPDEERQALQAGAVHFLQKPESGRFRGVRFEGVLRAWVFPSLSANQESGLTPENLPLS